MGIGIVSFGAAEPLLHYVDPRRAAGAGRPQAMRDAMRYMFYHRGLHPWAIYSALAPAPAYFHIRHQRCAGDRAVDTGQNRRIICK